MTDELNFDESKGKESKKNDFKVFDKNVGEMFDDFNLFLFSKLNIKF